MTKPNIGTKGRFGDTKRREGRIWELSPNPGPMDRFVVRDLPATEASEEATCTEGKEETEGKRLGRREPGKDTHRREKGNSRRRRRVCWKLRKGLGNPATTNQGCLRRESWSSGVLGHQRWQPRPPVLNRLFG